MNWLGKLKSALGQLAAIFSLDCKTVVRWQSEALEHPLSWHRRLGLRLHLQLCQWCRRYGRQLHFMHTAAHTLPEALAEKAPQKLSAEAKARLREAIRVQAK